MKCVKVTVKIVITSQLSENAASIDIKVINLIFCSPFQFHIKASCHGLQVSGSVRVTLSQTFGVFCWYWFGSCQISVSCPGSFHFLNLTSASQSGIFFCSPLTLLANYHQLPFGGRNTSWFSLSSAKSLATQSQFVIAAFLHCQFFTSAWFRFLVFSKMFVVFGSPEIAASSDLFFVNKAALLLSWILDLSVLLPPVCSVLHQNQLLSQ